MFKGAQSNGLEIQFGEQSGVMRPVGPDPAAPDRTVCAIYTTNAGQEIANNTQVRVDFEDKEVDTHDAVTTGASWVFTAPVTGYYDVSCMVTYTATTTWAIGEYGRIDVFIGAVDTYRLDRNDWIDSSGTAAYKCLSGSRCIPLDVYETLHIKTAQTSGDALALYNVGTYNWISIKLNSVRY